MTEITDNSLVSIITPVLNGIKYLEPCILSVLTQSYPYIEHILVDGGSTDGTLEMIKSYQDKHPDRIRYITGQDENAADAWNKGLSLARGYILGWLGSDDTCETDAIKIVTKFFRTNPDAYFVYGDYNIIDERKGRTTRYKASGGNLEQLLNGPFDMSTTSAFYRREVITQIGLMDTRLNGIGCDLDYWIRVADVFKMYKIDEVLSNFRVHEDSTCGSKDAFQKYARVKYVISRRHGGHIWSNYGIVFFGSPLIRLLRPVMGPLYHFISHRLIYPLMSLLGRLTSKFI